MQESPDSYRTIKALVFDHVHRSNGVVRYDALTKAVLRHFPDSLWQRSHWAWYRHQILKGRFREQFSWEERGNLKGAESDTSESVTPPPARGPSARDPKVKRIGDAILGTTRSLISHNAGSDIDLRFKLNRWVSSRLLLDERRTKSPVKKQLWDSGMRNCQACSHVFASLKGVEIHRSDPSQGYSLGNCELLCRDCHQALGSRPKEPIGG